MTATVLNIHEFYNELKGVGFNEQQAELIANLHSKSAAAAIEQAKHDYKLDDVATRCDIKELELKIEQSKNNLIMWMVSLGTAQVGAVFFILKMLDKI